jgi:UDP-N-acetylmuramate dehydrogenase
VAERLSRVAAGEPWDDVVALAVAEGWSGIEALSGIPGSAPARRPVQNVGAYGQEVAQTIAQVRTWDRLEETQTVRTFAAAGLPLSPTGTRLFKASEPVCRASTSMFQLTLADAVTAPIRVCRPRDRRSRRRPWVTRVPLADAREAVLAQRRRRGMVLDAE